MYTCVNFPVGIEGFLLSYANYKCCYGTDRKIYFEIRSKCYSVALKKKRGKGFLAIFHQDIWQRSIVIDMNIFKLSLQAVFSDVRTPRNSVLEAIGPPVFIFNIGGGV